MTHTDEYAKQIARQNQGETCAHCGSPSGHYKQCPLICRETAEARSAANGAALCQEDTLRLRSLGVSW